VRPLFNSQVREIRADVVVMDLPTGSRIVPNDYVVIRIGGEAPYALLERLGVRIVHKDVPVPQETADVG
jgi:hypothetical protein